MTSNQPLHLTVISPPLSAAWLCRQVTGAKLANCKKRIWFRPLEDGSAAVGFFNLAESPDELSLDVKDIGLSGSVIVRNLWERRDLGRIRDSFSIDVPAHGAQLVRVRP